MAGPLLTAKDLATGAVTFPKRKYDEATGKLRSAPVFCTFPAANTAYAFPHALGRVPSGLSPGPSGRNGGAPGTVYCDDLPFSVSKYAIVLKCSTANTWADITVF